MLPQNTLSTEYIISDFLPPRNRPKELLEDWERGGIGINDASEGLDVYDWKGTYDGSDIFIEVPGVISKTSIATVADVTEFQFTFDQNMQPFVCYMVSNSTSYFKWFDATIPGFVTTDMAANVSSPRCALDDKRDLSGILTGNSDIELIYIRNQAIYKRTQKDRYDTEYELLTGLGTLATLGQVGMNSLWRFQIEGINLFAPSLKVYSMVLRVNPETERGSK